MERNKSHHKYEEMKPVEYHGLFHIKYSPVTRRFDVYQTQKNGGVCNVFFKNPCIQ